MVRNILLYERMSELMGKIRWKWIKAPPYVRGRLGKMLELFAFFGTTFGGIGFIPARFTTRVTFARSRGRFFTTFA